MTPWPELPLGTLSKRDADHIALLAIFHFVFGALALLGIGFLALHFAIMRTVFSHSDIWKGKSGMSPPTFLWDIMFWLYIFLGAALVVGGTANIVSGFCLHRRRNRVLSFVVAALNCVHIPFGTVLGCFTIWVLQRDTVRQAYDLTRKDG